MRIRTFRDADIKGVLKLWRETGLYRERSDRPELVKRMARVQRGLFLVAEEDGELVGTAVGSFDGRRGLISRVGTAEKVRGRGLGTRLMETLEEKLRERGAMGTMLLVYDYNERAIALYERLGYERNDDVVFMAKTFSPQVAKNVNKRSQGKKKRKTTTKN